MGTIESRPNTRSAWEPSLVLEEIRYRWLALTARFLARKIRITTPVTDDDIQAAASNLGRREASEWMSKGKASVLTQLGFNPGSPDKESK